MRIFWSGPNEKKQTNKNEEQKNQRARQFCGPIPNLRSRIFRLVGCKGTMFPAIKRIQVPNPIPDSKPNPNPDPKPQPEQAKLVINAAGCSSYASHQ